MDGKTEREKLMEEFKRINREKFEKFYRTICESFDVFLERQSLAKDDWEMKCPYKDWDEYWFIKDFGDVFIDSWDSCEIDMGRFNTGNTFPTKQAAELESKRRNLLTRFRAFRNECNGDWKAVSGKQCKTSKFFIGYGWDSKDEQYKLKSLELGSSNLFHQFGYFKNREDCDQTIDLFGDEIKELFVEGE